MTGSTDTASEGVVRAELLAHRPIQRPGATLELVPGVVVTQHSSDGKANQYFLRGFNLDHGTDFATTVQGVPVNLPTHGHGHGYSDLNFLIPELIARIDYRKGPYFATHGDFASAGSADIRYRQRLDAPLLDLSLGIRGSQGYQRLVAAGSTTLHEGQTTLLAAAELMRNDGPWTVPEQLRKRNAVISLSSGTTAEGWSASLMHYQARWTATDQVPQRLLDASTYQGQAFSRFSSLDPSSGGDTTRTSVSADWHRDGAFAGLAGHTRVSAYAMAYDLALASNFTYRLSNPTDGDQFMQRDRRSVVGFKASQSVGHPLPGLMDALAPGMQAHSEFGLQLRHDRIRVGLFDTVQRQITQTVRDDRVRQTLSSLYAQTSIPWQPWLRTLAGLRLDHVHADVQPLAAQAGATVLAANAGSRQATLLSPKFSLILGPWGKAGQAFANTELFVSAGRGFHSNDARGALTRRDPRTGEPLDPVPMLVPSQGLELGLRTEPLPGWRTAVALWQLKIGSELVYVGDAGNTEEGPASRRYGLEWTNRLQPVQAWPWLQIDADAALTHARYRLPADQGRRIPNAVDRVASVALTVKDLPDWTGLRGFSGSLQWRYLGSAALVQDNSLRSRPSLLTQLRMAYQVNKHLSLRLDVFNLLNRRVDDIQYAYTSQLAGEAQPVFDRHVHPAQPRTLRLGIALTL